MVLQRKDLQELVIRAIKDSGGEAKIVDIAKHIWDHHEGSLRSSGNLFYTWQYDMRWAGLILRKAGKISDGVERGTWALKS
jgi:hypothetical protein